MNNSEKPEESGTKPLPPGMRFIAVMGGLVALAFPLFLAFFIWKAEQLVKLVRANNLEAVKRELEGTPLPPMFRSNGRNLLGYARSREMAELLMEKGENVNGEHGEDNETPLHAAAGYGRCEVLEVLVARGADVQHRDSAGETPLIEAAEHNETEAAAILLKHGAAAAVADRVGRTPLHHAARKGNGELVMMLLDAGADPAAKDRKGKSSAEYASEAGHRELAGILARKGKGEGGERE